MGETDDLKMVTTCVSPGMIVFTIDDGINRNGYMVKVIAQNPGVKLVFFVNGDNGASELEPSILRCPYGDHDESLLKIAKEQGMKAVVNWNYDSKRIL